MKPLLTIILPVGDPRPTLGQTIESVLSSRASDFELLISDNTQGKLELEETQVNDPRVRLIVQPVRISMADHWRELLAQADGEWVCFMGSDDGLVPNNLPKLLSLLSVTDSQVVSTHRIEIDWDQKFFAQTWTFPATPCSGSESKVMWPTLLSSFFPQFFFDLPMPYNKAVFRSEILSTFLEQENELYDVTPDYFLAFLLGTISNQGIFLDLPVFVHGGSEHSNGYQYATGSDTEYSKDFISRIKGNLQVVKNLPLDCQAGWLANSYLLCIFPRQQLHSGNWKKTVKELVFSKFYKFWITMTCTSCRTHIKGNSRFVIKMKRFILNKSASVIRSYVLPLRKNGSIPFHPGVRRFGESQISLRNLESHF